MIKLSIIAPIYNEAPILEELYERLAAAARKVAPAGDFEILFINDGSRDGSFAGIVALAKRHPELRFISFSRNFGHQVAVSAGLDHCRGEAVVIIDGDLQDPPELIPELYQKYQEGYKVVYARRRSREGETWFKKLTAKAFYRLLARMTNVAIPLDVGDFRIIDHEIVKYLRQMPERDKFLRGQIAWLGFRQTFLEFDRAERKSGQTGYSLSKMLRFAMDGITGFSDQPLKVATMMGFVVSFFALFIVAYALYSYFVLAKTITGWTSLIISVAFLGGVQLLSLGLIGEYISRINNNVRKRPLYVIDETNLDNDTPL